MVAVIADEAFHLQPVLAHLLDAGIAPHLDFRMFTDGVLKVGVDNHRLALVQEFAQIQQAKAHLFHERQGDAGPKTLGLQIQNCKLPVNF